MEVGGELSERLLCAAIARRFYLDGQAKSDIAKEFGINRFRVARLIEKALQSGIVRIEFPAATDNLDYELSSRMKSKYGLRHAFVVQGDVEGPSPALDNMGQVGAQLLSEISDAGKVLGFASTLTMEAVGKYITPFPAQAVVQLGGAWPGAISGQTSVELVHNLARITNSRAHAFYAPLIASDASAAEAIRRQTDVRAAEAMYAKVNLAVIGLGALQEGQSSLWPALSSDQKQSIIASGAVGEICGATFDSNGKPVETELSRRAIGIRLDQLTVCDEVLCLAFGKAKAPAIRSAICGGIIKSLITHSVVAEELIRLS